MAVFRINVTMEGHFKVPRGAIWGYAAQSVLFTGPAELKRSGPELHGAIGAACATHKFHLGNIGRVYIGEVFADELVDWCASARSQRQISFNPNQREQGVFLAVIQGPSAVGYSEVLPIKEDLSLGTLIGLAFNPIADRGNNCKLEESHLELIELSKEELEQLLPYARTESELNAEMDRCTEATGYLPNLNMHDWDEGWCWWESGEDVFRTCPRPEDFVPPEE